MMRRIVFLIFVVATLNCYGQSIKNISITNGDMYDYDNAHYYNAKCYSDSDFVLYTFEIDNKVIEKKKCLRNDFSQVVMNIDKPTLLKYIEEVKKEGQSKEEQIKMIDIRSYYIDVEFSDGTTKNIIVPAQLYLLSEDDTQVEKYKYYMNNLYFLLKYCFKNLTSRG